MDSIFFVDGEYVEAKSATLPVTDLAILRGYGVFDFLRTYKGEPFHLGAHVDRLFTSAAEVGMELPWSKDEVTNITNETLSRNDHPESNIRIVVTGGDSPDNITPEAHPRLLVMVTETVPPADHYYTEGARIVTVHTTRHLPLAKSLNYIPAIRALTRAQEQGAIEAVYVDSASHALEATTSNLFAFFGDKLVTPEADILPGITRHVVLELAEDVFEVQRYPLPLSDLYNADEVFITSSNKQVVPVIAVDDEVIGSGRPGKRTRRIMELFGAYTGVPLPLPEVGG